MGGDAGPAPPDLTVEVGEGSGATGWVCTVAVAHAGRVRRHVVRVSPAERARYGPDVPVDVLVRRSFAFLLEREPASAILPRFDLGTIERYFPEYGAASRRPSD